jgi:hypothetical protein
MWGPYREATVLGWQREVKGASKFTASASLPRAELIDHIPGNVRYL